MVWNYFLTIIITESSYNRLSNILQGKTEKKFKGRLDSSF